MRVTDGQTDGRTDRQRDGIAIATTALEMRALRRAVKRRSIRLHKTRGSLKTQDAKNRQKVAIWAPSHNFVGLYLRN